MPILALAAAAALSAQTADPATEADLRCVAVLALAGAKAPEDKKMALAGGLLFFAGRIEGRSPDLDLEAGLRRVSAGLTDAAVRENLTRCAGILQERGTYLSDIGKRMQATPAKP